MSIRGSVRVISVRGKLNMQIIVGMNGNDIVVVSVEVGATVIGQVNGSYVARYGCCFSCVYVVSDGDIMGKMGWEE